PPGVHDRRPGQGRRGLPRTPGTDEPIRPGPRWTDRRVRTAEGGRAGTEEPLAPRERALRDPSADVQTDPRARGNGRRNQEGRAPAEHLQVRVSPARPDRTESVQRGAVYGMYLRWAR